MPRFLALFVPVIFVFATAMGTCPGQNGTGDDDDDTTTTPSDSQPPSESESPTVAPSLNLVSAGNKWGECLGNCRHELNIKGMDIRLEVSEYLGSPVYVTNTGTLTAAGFNRLVGVRHDLQTRNLQSVYGCPDCDDGGASWIVIDDGNNNISHHEYEWGNPPPELQITDGFTQDIWQAMRACTDSADITMNTPCTSAN